MLVWSVGNLVGVIQCVRSCLREFVSGYIIYHICGDVSHDLGIEEFCVSVTAFVVSGLVANLFMSAAPGYERNEGVRQPIALLVCMAGFHLLCVSVLVVLDSFLCTCVVRVISLFLTVRG